MITLTEVLANISTSVPELMRLVTSLAYISGMYFVVSGIASLRKMPPIGGDNQTTLSKCITLILVGAGLLYLPSSIRAVTYTFFTTTVPFDYVSNNEETFHQFLSYAFQLIQLVGVVSFIRGMFILTQSPSSQDAHPVGRAITHIVGGALCINMVTVLTVLFATFGLTGVL